MSLESNDDVAGSPGFSRILALMFCMGVYALLAQVLLLREFLVVFFGNELTIGAVFSAWLALIGAGSLLTSFFVSRWTAERLRVLLVVLPALAAFLLPLQIVAIRVLRTALHVAYGEYVPFFSMLASMAAILAPGCLIVGIVFPYACRLAAWPSPARQSPLAVSRVYAVESLGSMVAGAAFSFWLVWVMRPLSVAALAGAIVLLSAAWLANRRTCRWLLGLMAAVFAVSACCPVCLAPWERASVEARWRSFGALPSSGSSSPLAPRLLASCDSRYQNFALIETEGQMALYANGQVMAVFPDAVTGEHKIHFIMAQKPDARRVLLIGGNPANDVPELLKYPLEQLVYVELDEKIGRLLEPVANSAYRQALRDPRLVQVHMDAPRYVKQYGRSMGRLGAEMHVADAIAPADLARYQPHNKEGSNMPAFDAILVDAAEPATIALNRFYTQEFYRDIRRILSPGGFLYSAVAASDDLQGETAYLSASICAALRTVFERVLVTAGTKNQFFAGATNSPITLARATLFRRSAGADIKTRYFRPEYFLNADDISPEKIDFVERRLAAIPVEANTVLKPVSTFYQIALWSRFSGSGLEALLARLARLRLRWVAGALLGFGVACLGMGVALGRRPACAKAAVGRQGSVVSASIFSRSMLLLVMAVTGLCGMALELILIFMFQALLGYVYSKVGLIVAVFMLGLTLGAFGAPRLIRRGVRWQWRAMVGMEILLIAAAACIPWVMTALSSGPMNWIPWAWVEAFIYGLIAGSGALVGAQFALVNELMASPQLHLGCQSQWTQQTGALRLARPHVAPFCLAISADSGQAPNDLSKIKGRTAALTNAADLAGAALGGLAVGVLLLPLFGITAACFLLAALKLASLLCLLAARRANGIGSRDGVIPFQLRGGGDAVR